MAIEFTVVAHERLAKRRDDRLVAGLAALAHGVRDDVGIEHVGAAGGEQVRDFRFAAADAAGEADKIRLRHQSSAASLGIASRAALTSTNP